ncbi:methyltransferase [Kiloniella sp. EL199]|uniref:methyltransferase n=1 Tax=Kiloniella sp. EL199 TaxID=2107581 RepID=UPI000EA1A6CE|nr:methyltransferase [Kiloniella sp. EL199]
MKFKDIANYFLFHSSLLLLRVRLCIQSCLKLTHEYQPNPFKDDRAKDLRACHDRYEAIKRSLEGLETPSSLDLGCNQGYFTFRLAEKGGYCIGIDNDRSEIMAAKAKAAINRINNVAFSELTLDAESIENFPQTDVTVCLSIFHHWVRFYGQEQAEKMLFSLAKRTKKALVFDTGQPEEESKNWAKELEFMAPDSRTWIEEHLKGIGFTEIDYLGEFPTSVSPVPRHLFVAKR